MNKFSDEQLARLKERNLDSLGHPISLTQSEWKALLARLEAAEKALQSAYGFVDVGRKELRAHSLYEAWLQSCAEEIRALQEKSR